MAKTAARVAIVTGGGTGIGAATARALAAGGMSVIVTGRRAEPLEDLAEHIGGVGVVADVTSEDDWSRVVAVADERFGGVDVLVANAGIEAFGSVETVTLDEWRAVQRTNVDGVLLGIRAVAPSMRSRGGGSIVVVSSVAGLTSGPEYAAYVTSKIRRSRSGPVRRCRFGPRPDPGQRHMPGMDTNRDERARDRADGGT